jgi:hypothetical protein
MLVDNNEYVDSATSNHLDQNMLMVSPFHIRIDLAHL